MSLLLDSHAFLWFVHGDRRSSVTARTSIEAAETDVYVSAATAWELTTKARTGKQPETLAMTQDFDEILQTLRFRPLAISIEHGRLAGLFDSPHKDPFDRMLAAQARTEGLCLVTADPAFASFGVTTIW